VQDTADTFSLLLLSSDKRTVVMKLIYILMRAKVEVNNVERIGALEQQSDRFKLMTRMTGST
jgi:hypothetical protein